MSGSPLGWTSQSSWSQAPTCLETSWLDDSNFDSPLGKLQSGDWREHGQSCLRGAVRGHHFYRNLRCGKNGSKKKKNTIRFDVFTHSSNKYLNYLSVCQLMSTVVSKSGKGKQGPAESSWAHILGPVVWMYLFLNGTRQMWDQQYRLPSSWPPALPVPFWGSWMGSTLQPTSSISKYVRLN